MAGNKDNMRQAMRELLGKMASGAEPKPEVSAPVKPEETPWTPPAEPLARQVEEMFPEYGVYGGANASSASNSFKEFKDFKDFKGYTSERRDFGDAPATVISEGTFINGDIRSDGNVEIRGKLKGNLETAGNVRVSGKMIGDIRGESVTLISCAIQGNIVAGSTVSIDAGTLLVGDVLTGSLTTDGKVKGNIQATKSVVFQSNAVLAGNVTASVLSMAEGAKIQGVARVAQDKEVNSLFDENLEL